MSEINAEEENPLFRPLHTEHLDLRHRIVLAPLTRYRAGPTATCTNVPKPFVGEYYAQRSTNGGLLITEAVSISLMGTQDPWLPGIWQDEQVNAWGSIPRAVHAKGGVIFMQLWHCGRTCHSTFLPGIPVSASALAIKGVKYQSRSTLETLDYEVPRALLSKEITDVIQSFAQAAHNAVHRAGFDGIELHAANGYLIHQFLSTSSNIRTDEYGGSIENRARFLLDTVRACIDVTGPGRVGVRLSPFGRFNDMHEEDTFELYTYVLGALSTYPLAYVHFIRPRVIGNRDADPSVGECVSERQEYEFQQLVRSYQGVRILAGGYTPETARQDVSTSSGKDERPLADLVAFGRMFTSNPDLPDRIQHQYPLRMYQRATFYTNDREGYTTFSPYNEAAQILN